MHASRLPATRTGAALVPAAAGAGLLALTVIAYAPFLGTGFAGTDSLPLVETSRINSLADVVRQFSQPVMAGTRFVLGEVMYRPFVSFTFGLDYAVWGQNATGYHLTNLVLHLAGVLGVWGLLNLLGLKWWSSLFGAAVFALHPLGVASVPVIARRDSVLPVAAFTVGVAALLWAERACGARQLAWRLVAGLLLAIALLSKESAFAAMAMLPMLLASLGLSRGDTLGQVVGRLRGVLPFLALAGVAFVVRFVVLGGLGGAPDDKTGLTHVDWNVYSQTLGAYARDLLWPFAPLAASTREVWPRLAGVVAVLVAATLVWLPRRQAVLAAAGGLWVAGFGAFCVALKLGTIAWLGYFALVGLALLVAAAFEGSLLGLRQRAARRLAAAVLLAGVAVLAASSLWASPLVRDYYQWRQAGELTTRFMQALSACAAGSPHATQVIARGLPSDLDDGQVDTLLLGVTLFEDYTVEAGLRMAFPARPFSVQVASIDVLRNGANQPGFACNASSDDQIDFTTTY